MLIAGDTIKIGPSLTTKTTIKEKQTNPLGKTRFFTLDRVGLFPEKGGTKVTAVTPRSAAAAAGLLAGDEVAEVNGVKTADAAALRHALLRAYAFEEPAVLKVVRGGKTLTVTIPVHGR